MDEKNEILEIENFTTEIDDEMAEYISFLKRKVQKPEEMSENVCGNMYSNYKTFLNKEKTGKDVKKDADEDFFAKIKKIVKDADKE